MAIIIATGIAVFLDIPILRQLLSFIFLTILPGLLFLFLLKLNHLSFAEKSVLVIGMSIAFLMLFGWALNQVCLLFGYTSPLSTVFITFSLGLALIVLAVVAYLTNRGAFSSSTFHLALNTRSKLCLLLPSLFLLMSIIGTRMINSSGNNTVLMVFLFLIPVAIIVIVLQRHRISPDTYPVAIVLIAFSLLSMFWLRSEHILGHDVHLEYYFFQKTLQAQYWSIFEYGTLNSCLSISLLPTLYQSMLDVNSQEQLFKGLYTVISSFTPLVVYITSKKYLGEANAFLAALFFSFGALFLASPGIPRFSTAVFFFAFSIMVLFTDNIPLIKRRGLLIIFITATIISHYATAYIFLFIVIFVTFAAFILRKNIPSGRMTIISVILFFVLIFFWYSHVTEAPFISGVSFIRQAIINLGNFFIIETRSQEAMTVFGGGGMKENPFLSWIHFAVTWVCFFIIAWGVIGTLLKRRNYLLYPQHEKSALPTLQARFDSEYFLLAIACCGLAVAILVLPRVSIGYETQRVYTQVVVVLSTFFIMGSVMLAQRWRWRANLLILMVLIPYFLFNTGALYELFGFHDKTWLLSAESSACRSEFVYNQESLTAKWLEENRDASEIYVFDAGSSSKLYSQGGIPSRQITHYPAYQDKIYIADGYFFLSRNNVVYGDYYMNNRFFSLSPYSEILESRNKLYANGVSEIYR